MQRIFLFTHSYPYGKLAETFLNAEIEVASLLKVNLTIVPLRKDAICREVPENILLNKELAEASLLEKIEVAFKMLFSSYFWKLPFQGIYSPKSLSDFKNGLKYLYGSFLVKEFILSNKNEFSGSSIIYSYWFTSTSLGAILAKEELPSLNTIKVITRAHGFDVYEKQVGIYFPFRIKTFTKIDHVYTVSQKGKEFMREKYSKFKDKISMSHLGIVPIKNEIIESKSDRLTLLSCSLVNKVKRVDLIFKSIAEYAKYHSETKVKWVHIGDGFQFSGLKALVRENNIPNFEIEIKGFLNNSEVREILKGNWFDVFINLSTSEGIPVSIMEAISAGIPVLATNAGGNCEIVTDESGVIIPIDFSQEQFNDGINNILSKRGSLKKSTLEFFKKNYDAEENFKTFYKNILN